MVYGPTHNPATCHYCRLTRDAVQADPRINPRGTCPGSIPCPQCRARAGRRCKRPSEHDAAEMHSERYRAVEQADARECPGFEPYHRRGDGAASGCAHCSGLPEDHPQVAAAAAAAPAPPRAAQLCLF